MDSCQVVMFAYQSVANEKLLKPLKYLNDFKIGWKREQVEVYTETMKKWTGPWQWALNLKRKIIMKINEWIWELVKSISRGRR